MNKGTLAYLATPYSRFPHGPFKAFREAALVASRLLRSGVNVYSPIVHAHPVALYGIMNPFDHSIWLPFDDVMMSRCDVLIVAHMDGWHESIGIAHEVKFFEAAGKPIFDLPDITIANMVRRV